jgi:hypothetical protein
MRSIPLVLKKLTMAWAPVISEGGLGKAWERALEVEGVLVVINGET